MTIELSTLPNGFRIVSERMDNLASATIGVWVEAGARDERAEENGVAHFLEHMAFKGTHRRTALQIAEEIENVGGYLNAYTSRERTAYYARVLADDVPLALDILADILRDPLLAEPEIEIERGVILQEIGQALDTPDDIIFDWLQEAAFPDQPMGRPVLGSPERVRAFERAELAGFIARQYGPQRMILSAAGAVEHGDLVQAAERLFGDMHPIERERPGPALYQGGERRVDKALEQAHFAMALQAPGQRDDSFFAAQIAAGVLGGGMSSRLFQEAREKRGLCYSIFAQHAAWADTGLLMIYAGTGAEELGALMELTADQISRAADDLSKAEVDRLRAQTKAGLVMGLESPSARAERMAAMLSIWGRVPSLAETVAKIDAVGPDEARAAVAGFARSRPALALYGPVRGAPELAAFTGRLAA